MAYINGKEILFSANVHTGSELNKDTVVERMLEVDKRGLESGDYNKEQYDTFRAKFPNRVYLEKYNKYADGSEVERIYNKVALTAMPEAPWDFDEGDYGYRLESVPLRLGGGKPTDPGAYQEGHIRVPKLSKSEFPKEEDAKTFAITKVYADSAIVEGYQVPLIKSGYTLDDKCICVESKSGVYSSISTYGDNPNTGYVAFEAAVWCDFSNNTSGNIEFFGYDRSHNRGLFFYIGYDLKVHVQTSNGYSSFDARNYIRSKEWFKLRVEMVSGASIKIFINDELMIQTVAGTFAGQNIYMLIGLTSAFVGKIALANVAFLTASSRRELSDENYYNLDEYTNLTTTVPTQTTRKVIVRSDTTDVWNVEDYETFTDDDGYVLVNKKYLRKMLENAGGGSSGGASKIYKHTVTFNWCCEAAYYFAAIISFNSTDSTPINTQTQFLKNAEKIKTAEIVTVSSFYYEDIMDEVDYYEVVSIEVSASEFLVYYRMSPGGSLMTARYWATPMSDGSLAELNVESDTVTEV